MIKRYVENGHGITREGKRRWISQWEYCKEFGEFPEYKTPDLRTDKTVCKWCGEKLKNKRQQSFCGTKCSERYNRILIWQNTVPKVPWCAIVRDRFACTECGESGLYKNEYGIYIPASVGLEVHHIVPISKGGTDRLDNLETLCTTCHYKRHGRVYF